jgi:hypothetical protein
LSDGQRPVQKDRLTKYNPDDYCDIEPDPSSFGDQSVQMKPISHCMTIRGYIIIGSDYSDDISWLEFQRYYNLIQNGIAPSNDVEDIMAVDFKRLKELDEKFQKDGDKFLNPDGRQVNRAVERYSINEIIIK